MTLVSIIVPVFNGEEFLAKTLESAISSNHRPLEIIVIDDGSKDNSAKIAEEVLQSADVTGKVISQDNLGEPLAVNRGVSESSGDYFMVLSADDLIEPVLVTKSLEIMESNPKIGVVYPDQRIIDELGRTIELEEKADYSIDKLFGELQCLPGVGTMVRASILGGHPPRNPRYFLISDYVFWLQLSTVTQFQRIPGFLASWRVHSSGTSSLMSVQNWGLQLIAAIEEFFNRQSLGKEHLAVKRQTRSLVYLVGGRRQKFPANVGFVAKSLLISPCNWFKLAVRFRGRN